MFKKISLLSLLGLLFAVIVYAGSTNVWTGSFDPASWGSALDVSLSDVKAGDKVVFQGTAYDNAQIQISSKDWSTMYTGDYSSFNGSYTINVTSENASKLSEGVHVKGQNFTLTSVVVERAASDDASTTTFAELPWKGSFDPNAWNNALALKASGLKEGQQIVFHGEAGSNAQIQFGDGALKNFYDFDGHNYTDFEDGFAIDITADNKTFFENGFKVKGQDFTLTSVVVESAASDDASTTTFAELPWKGSFDPNAWNNALALKASGLKEGQQIVFHGEAGSNAQIQLGDGALKNFYDFDGENYTDFEDGFAIDITADNKTFFENGFKVKGQDFTLTSVTVGEGGGSGDEPGDEPGGNTGGNTGSGTVTTGEGFHTSGTKLLDANGNEFIMRGVNYSWCWQYGNGDGNTADDVIPAAKRIGANVIRIQLADGGNHSWKKPTAAELSNLIKLCEDNKIIAIFNTHDETGSDKVSELERAANFWISYKDLLNAHRATVLINISNEWYGSWEADPWAAGYEKVIPMIRNAGIKNTLVVDCAGYGQYPASIPKAGAKVLAADKDKNLIFSEHLYDCFPSASDVDKAIDDALTVGAPVIVGEFSYNHKGHSVAWQEILDHCQAKGIGYLGWSWTGNGGGTEACDMFGGYDESDMKENGKCIILGRNGIKQTSKECSVFSGIKGGGGNVSADANYLPWTGSAVAGDGKLFSAAGFAVGDTIQFVGTGSGKITIAKEDGTTIASGDFSGDYRLAVTDANFSALTGTFKLLGNGYTIIAMNKKRYVKGDNQPIVPVENGYRITIWEGSFPIEWSGNGLKLLGYRFDGAKTGDKLIFTISDPVYAGKKGPQLQIGNSGYSAMVESNEGQGCVDIKKGTTTYSFILNAENADDLINGEQDGGLRIKGQNCTLTSVVLETATPQYEYTKTAIFTPKGGSLDMGMWSDDALTKIDKMKFVNAGLEAGDRVVFNLTETEETEVAQLQIVTLSPSWETLRPEFKNIGVQTPRFWFTVTAEEAEALRTKSMGIKGTKCILKSIEVWHRNGQVTNTTGISTVSADTMGSFDMAAPYEIYSITGQRLNNFENGRRQVYIVRQNGKTYKVFR